MSGNLDDWLEDLAGLRLPILAGTRRSLDQAMGNPITSHADLGRIAARDPGLSLGLYRELKASGHSPGEEANPARLMGLLGLTRLQQLAGSLPVLEDRYRGPALQGLRASYGRALLSAHLARRLAALRAQPQPDEDAAAGLLQGLGEMALWARKPGTMKSLGGACARPEDQDFTALHLIGICPSELGEALARRWDLPHGIVRSQRPHNSIDPNCQSVLLAVNLAWAGLRDWQSADMDELIALAAQLTHLEADKIRNLVHREAATAARTAHELGLPHGGDRLLLAPGESHLPELEPATQQAASPPPSKTPPEAAPKPSAPKRPAMAASPPAATTNPLQQRLTETLGSLRDALGLERILLALPNRDRGEIRARFVLERQPSELATFRVPARTRNLFSLLTTKSHALWINPGNQMKYLPFIPEEAATLIDMRGFFAVSLVVRERPVGVIYADAGGRPLDEGAFAAFRRGCAEVGELFNTPAPARAGSAIR